VVHVSFLETFWTEIASDAVSQGWGVKVDDESHRCAGQFEIRQNLGFVDRMDAFNRFDFQKDKVVDEKVQPERFAGQMAFIDNGYGLLAGERQAGLVELDG
jgi:hypothetical protein